jgi:hypothetical protein
MASPTSTNVNGKKTIDASMIDGCSICSLIEILPGLETFLRSMLNTTHLDTDHRQIAAMYIDDSRVETRLARLLFILFARFKYQAAILPIVFAFPFSSTHVTVSSSSISLHTHCCFHFL